MRGRYGGVKGSGTSRPNQKVGPICRPFGSTVISKTCFRNFQGQNEGDQNIANAFANYFKEN